MEKGGPIAKSHGKAVTRYEFSSLFAEAWYAAMTAKNIQAGFKVTGVFPFNRHPFDLPNEKYKSFKPEEVVRKSKLKYIHCTVLHHVAEGIYQMTVIMIYYMKQNLRIHGQRLVAEGPFQSHHYVMFLLLALTIADLLLQT